MGTLTEYMRNNILSMEQILSRIREIEFIHREDRTADETKLLAYLTEQVKIKSYALPNWVLGDV